MICLLSLLPSIAKASETPESENAPVAKKDVPASTPLYEGSPAPFNGILMPPETAANLWKKLEVCEKTAEADAQKSKALIEAEKTRCAKTIAALEERQQELKTDLAKAYDLAKRKWYESPYLWSGTGCVAGGVVTAATLIGLIWLTGQVADIAY